MNRRGVASISSRFQQSGIRVYWYKRSKMDCPMDELSEREFQAHFHILDSIDIQVLDRDALSIDKLP